MDLLKEMSRLVEKYTKHYKDDFYLLDTKRLKREATKGKVFYWLVRECGTALTTKDRMLIDSDRWSEYVIFEHYNEQGEERLYEITITDKTGENIEGKLKKISLPKLLQEYREKQKPALLNIHTDHGSYTRPWNEQTEHENVAEFVAKQQGIMAENISLDNIYVTFSY